MKKSQILKDKSVIDVLFAKGKLSVPSISNDLIILKFMDSTDPKFLFAVSSAKFKRAVDRNKIKRLMKESTRKLLGEVSGKTIAVVYRGKEVPKYEDVNKSIIDLIKKIK